MTITVVSSLNLRSRMTEFTSVEAADSVGYEGVPGSVIR